MSDGGEDDTGDQLALVLSDRATVELNEAVASYETERSGLGLAFLAAVDAVHALLRRHPQIGAEVRPRIRRALLRRFPYGVFYVINERHIRVLAIIHSHRHPARWPRRA
ncbi:MAG: type II toxin-antitoxin system RelE/ParE family toxin [Gemmatimonadaceae bacterium]